MIRAGAAIALAAVCLLACAALAQPRATLRVERLDRDLPLAALADVRTAGASSWRDFGDGAPRPVPYARDGTWLRVTFADAIPADPVLVVWTLVAGPVTLVAPSGATITRNKLEPELGSSPLALDFPLPPQAIAPSRTLLLHFSHQHRALTRVALMSNAEWQRQDRSTFALVCSLYAAMAAFAVIAFCYWAILRERMFADYTLYLVCLLALMAANAGLLYALPGASAFARLGIHGQWMLFAFGIAFAIGFALDFLDLRRHAPRWARAFERVRAALLVTAVATAAAPFVFPLAWISWLGMALVAVLIATNVAMLALGVHVVRRDDRFGWYYLAGWIPLTAATTARGLQSAGILTQWTELENLYAIGAVWEALVLTLGIADRVLAFRRERDLARSAAEHDALTGVLNRRALEARLRALAHDAREGGNALALLFIDIDHFKLVNDEHGHDVGDACLVAVAKHVADELRGGDFVARYGGEEFVVLLSGAALEDARRVAESIRQRVAGEPVRTASAAVAVTVSIGVAVFDSARDDVADLMRRADTALYRAKNDGRNRVTSAVFLAA